ncbi:MFS transporter [Actinopolymorpha sp. B17G11]|uniref:MFS transporter n=1 Tax=Actinopolymorpha sp. B17G11 TaxID=3160861 RepID=UPI0032E50D38
MRSVATPYAAVLRAKGAWRFYVWSVAPRLGGAMLGLGMVWLIHWATGSYAAAGVVAGAYALAGAVIGPHVARLIDTFGQPRTVPLLLALNGAATVTLVAAASAHASLVILAGIAAVAAACGPQFPALSRARWSYVHAGSPQLSTAFALESLTDEVPFILGPALVGTLSALVHPTVGPLAAVVLLLASGIPFALERSTAPPPSCAGSGPRPQGVLRMPGLLPLLGVFVTIGLLFGAMQVTVTAAAIQSGDAALAGPMYSAFSLLSMLAGVAYGAVTWRVGVHTRLVCALAALTILYLPLLVVTGQPMQAIAVALPGLAIAPALIAGNTLAEQLSDRRTLTQTFTWLASAIALGLAAGQTAAGYTADTLGVHWGFAIPALSSAAGATLALLTRSGKPIQRQRPDQPPRCHKKPDK